MPNSVFNKIDDAKVRKSLLASIWDGSVWAVMFGCTENFLALYALYLQASSFTVSIIQGLGLFAITLGQLVGARVLVKIPTFRKRLIIITVQLHALSWLLIFFTSYVTKNPYFIILFLFLGVFTTNLAAPGWLSWMNHLVPKNIRGEYWGFRNKILGIAQFLSSVVAGLLLQYFKASNQEVIAFGILFVTAFCFRFSGSLPLSLQHEPKLNKKDMDTEDSPFKFRIFLTKLITTNFGRFALFCFLNTLAVYIMSPILIVFLKNSLNFSYLEITIINLTIMVTTFLSIAYWGKLSDKYGNYRILFITAIGIPLLPLFWIFFKNFYLILLLQAIGGFMWSGFNLAVFNYMLDAVEPKNITRISAYFNSLNNTFAFLGATLGGFLSTITPAFPISFFAPNSYEIIFFISFLLRAIVLVILIKKFKEVRSVEPSPEIQYFYLYKPVTDVMNQFQILRSKLFTISKISKKKSWIKF